MEIQSPGEFLWISTARKGSVDQCLAGYSNRWDFPCKEIASCHTRSVLRRLLRLVDRHVTSHNGNGLWRNYLLKEFRRKTDGQSQQEIQHWITCAGQYAELIHSVQSHKSLLESYNITTDKDAQQRELIEKTAKRVGFKLPQVRQN